MQYLKENRRNLFIQTVHNNIITHIRIYKEKHKQNKSIASGTEIRLCCERIDNADLIGQAYLGYTFRVLAPVILGHRVNNV